MKIVYKYKQAASRFYNSIIIF